jgi:hypothetical protein
MYDTDLWCIEDIRLRRSAYPNPLWPSAADAFTAHVPIANDNEASWLRRQLRELHEKPGPEGLPEITWCTYDGICRGQTGEALVMPSVLALDPIYHSRSQVDAYVERATKDWAALQPPAGDSAWRFAATFKHENPHRQPLASDIELALAQYRTVPGPRRMAP